MIQRPTPPRRPKMTDTSQPSDVARETLRQLAMRRIAPTPDNYRALYHEIAGSLAEEVFPERAFKQIAAALPRHNRESLRLAREFESAISQAEWPALRAVMADAFSRTEETNLNWGNLLRDLVSEWDRRQAGLTQARKREMLDRVLTASGGNPEKLFERMQGLLRAWSRNSDEDLPGNEAADSAEAVQTVAPTPRDTTSPLCTELLAGLLDGIAAQAKLTEPDLANEAGELAGMIRQGPAIAPELVRQRLDKLRARLEWSAEDQHAVRDALQRVLQLILENISELVVDDRWLHGQIALMGEMFDHPLDNVA